MKKMQSRLLFRSAVAFSTVFIVLYCASVLLLLRSEQDWACRDLQQVAVNIRKLLQEKEFGSADLRLITSSIRQQGWLQIIILDHNNNPAVNFCDIANPLQPGDYGRFINNTNNDTINTAIESAYNPEGRIIVSGNLFRKDGNRYGTLILVYTLREMLGYFEQMAVIYFLLLAGALMFLLLFGYRSTRKPLRNVEKIADGAKELRAGDFKTRIKIDSDDEPLNTIAAGFNVLSASLESKVSELQARNMQLAAANERQKAFAGNAAHELQTPLAIIKSAAEVLLEFGAGNPELQASRSQMIYRESERLAGVTKTLLLLSRFEAPLAAGQLDLQPTDVSALLENDINRIQAAWNQKNCRFHCEIPREVFVETDARFASMVFSNIVDNAVKYSETGGMITIRLSLPDCGYLLITVHNNGRHIPPEDIANIFEPFFRSSSHCKPAEPGNGLGLSLVAQIAILLKWQVTATSSAATGTVFSVSIPAPHIELLHSDEILQA